MSASETLPSAERTALNVFHDLQLAHVRQEDESVRAPSEDSSTTKPPVDPQVRRGASEQPAG
jgi:hypothetical protein